MKDNRMKETEKTLLRRKENKKRHSKKQMTTFDVAFKFLYIIVENKVRSQERIPQERNASEENIGIEIKVTFNNFDSKMLRSTCQSSITLISP